MSGGDEDGWKVVSPKRQSSNERRSDETQPDDEGGDIVVYSPPKKEANRVASSGRNVGSVQSFVLILVGIPGSGKSKFASRLVELAPWKYERVNQDIIGNRQACEDLTRAILSKNKIPIIDRCNFNPEQRKYWIDIAKEARVPVDCIIFSYNAQVCIRRCQERRGHETITARNASIVVRKMSEMFEAPVPIDGSCQNARSSNGEVFRKIARVSSFDMADDLVGRYLEY